MASAVTQPDPACPLCSKPITSGNLVLFEHGELFHVRCMSERLGLSVMREADRARSARTRASQNLDRAAHLLEELKRVRPARPPDGDPDR
jgi:hypothetical protein